MTRPAWPFLHSVVRGVIVRNGPPADTAPTRAPKQRKAKKATPVAQEARW